MFLTSLHSVALLLVPVDNIPSGLEVVWNQFVARGHWSDPKLHNDRHCDDAH